MNERDAIRTAAAHEIFRISLEGLADRMQDSLLRAACSVVAREGMDCAAALFLPDGRGCAPLPVNVSRDSGPSTSPQTGTSAVWPANAELFLARLGPHVSYENEGEPELIDFGSR